MKIVAFLLCIALVVASNSTLFAAVSDPKEAVTTELIAGTAGGAALGFGVAYLLGQICLSQTTGLEAIGCIGAIISGYLLGMPSGAILGVNLAGASSGVQGNTLLSVLGGVGGGALGVLSAFVVSSVFESEAPEWVGFAIFLVVAPAVASLGATWGFNSGARLSPEVEQPAANPSQLTFALNQLVP